MQGILFGPIAFITIPIGCVIGGAFHDYMTGMISVRNEGKQMPDLVHRFPGQESNVSNPTFWIVYGVIFAYYVIATPVSRTVADEREGRMTFYNMMTAEGFIAIIGVIVLPVTSGDTALRSLRLMIGAAIHLDQTKKKNDMPYIIALIPGAFYMYVISCYIINTQIGLNLNLGISYVLSGILAAVYIALLVAAKDKDSL